MKIGQHEIGYGQPTFIIAECCSNIIRNLAVLPNNLERIMECVADTGANAVKCQLYRANSFPEAERESKRRTEFPRELFASFVQLAHQNGLAAGASVFDEEAIQLCEDSDADFLKLATREFDNPFLESRCDNSKLWVLQSFDIWKYHVRSYIQSSVPGWTYLACDPRYPTLLPSIPAADGYGKEQAWGWSSHTPDDWLDVCIAVSRGACVVEKHIAFHDDDPERGWSLLPQDFRRMVEDIRRVEKMR